MGTASAPWWIALLVATVPTLIALTGTLLVMRSQRRSSKEANQVSQRNAVAAERSAAAAGKSSAIAERSADQSAKAAEQLNSFRLHDDTMKTLYWAADHAVVADSSRALLGLEVLGVLVAQAEDDEDYRGRRLVQATSEAVKTVAIPTFLSVLTSAVTDDDGDDGGSLAITAVELNAAKLLLAHAQDLTAELRSELEVITQAGMGHVVEVEELHAGRHLDARVELARSYDPKRKRPLDPGMGLSL